jgi:L-cysteine S-thiosulfotransferase
LTTLATALAAQALAKKMRLGAVLLATAAGALAQPWPASSRLSGNAFLPPGLLQLQADTQNSPVALWLDKGQQQWADATGGASCQSCHGAPQSLRDKVPTFPKLVPASPGSPGGSLQLINLEDQIVACRTRAGRLGARLDDDDVLSLSALLHSEARGLPINVQPVREHMRSWTAHLEAGTALFAKRLGRINLACVHCHEQSVGKQMRIDVISPGNPTGFPIYRMSWQKLGSMDRRLRACYSGVQAIIPPPGAPELRDLELYLKVRANGMPIEGPSIRR